MNHDIIPYLKHLPNCNIMQDWSEADSAFAHTPNNMRDEGYSQAVEDLNTKRQTCACGLHEIQKDLIEKGVEGFWGRACARLTTENKRLKAQISSKVLLESIDHLLALGISVKFSREINQFGLELEKETHCERVTLPFDHLNERRISEYMTLMKKKF